MQLLVELQKELRDKANPAKAKILSGFFKTKPGQYGDGDIFIGVTVPQSRNIAQKYSALGFADTIKLLNSKIHEERLVALLIFVYRFRTNDAREQKKIFEYYFKNSKKVNNWDLVDLSADKIVGAYLLTRPRGVLCTLARSNNIWQRRIAIIATFQFIKHEQYRDTLKIAKILLRDEHDLIHKAVGWMLREVGKRSVKEEESFLSAYYTKMPRTMLRYAIERFPESRRKQYLKGQI